MSVHPRVLVAMSGGVDSSVAAALLLEQGYDVVGVTMRITALENGTAIDADGPAGMYGPCCGLEASNDARHVAQTLGIDHHVVNYVDQFEAKVIADFVGEYQAGRTPNPCVRCNQRLKFGSLFDKAQVLGAELVATGHYVRLEQRAGRQALRRAVYRPKDQSYALAGLTQEQLSRALFPLGALTKEQTRNRARALGLTTAEKAESQEVCFVPDGDYRRFLTERTGAVAPGPIVSTTGEILGRHHGAMFYTIGQRRGLGIAAPRPYYVVGIDIDRNTLVVAHEEDTYCAGLVAHEICWGALAPQAEPFACAAQIRYLHKGAPARAVCANDTIEVQFDQPQRAVTPGQWVVLYDEEDRVLVAGIIARAM